MVKEIIEHVKYAYNMELEDESVNIVTADIQNRLSMFAKEFNRQKGTLTISVIGRGLFRCQWEGVDHELSDQMAKQVSPYVVPTSH